MDEWMAIFVEYYQTTTAPWRKWKINTDLINSAKHNTLINNLIRSCFCISVYPKITKSVILIFYTCQIQQISPHGELAVRSVCAETGVHTLHLKVFNNTGLCTFFHLQATESQLKSWPLMLIRSLNYRCCCVCRGSNKHNILCKTGGKIMKSIMRWVITQCYTAILCRHVHWLTSCGAPGPALLA